MSAWHRLVLPIMKYFRGRRVEILRDACPELFDERPLSVCDLGGSRHFWAALPIDLVVKRVTIFNISESETGHCSGAAAQIPVHLYDGKRLPVGDQTFDLLISNSVIEHVPLAERTGLAAEMLRCSRKVVMQTPALEFPIEPHFLMPFLHWCPRGLGSLLVFVSPWFLLARPGMSRARSYFDEVSLLSRSAVRKLFPSGRILEERILGMTKSFIVAVESADPAKH